MKKLTADEILDIIKENYTEDAFARGEWDEAINSCKVTREEADELGMSFYALKGQRNREALGLGRVELVDSYGGEGQGETWYAVWHFVNHDVYIRIDGHYTSYNGVDFYQGYGREVRPVEKVVTVFE